MKCTATGASARSNKNDLVAGCHRFPAYFSFTRPSACNYIAVQAAGDLLPEEFRDIFDSAPKFPDEAENKGAERIDVDSFVQVYRDIDDLFESNESDNDIAYTKEADQIPLTQTSPATKKDVVDMQVLGADDGEGGAPDPSPEAELLSIYESICDLSGLVPKSELRKWDEVAKLLCEGLLSEDEFDEIWGATKRVADSGAEEKLDVDGFLRFNLALDDLFAFEDDEMDDVIVPKSAYTTELDAPAVANTSPSARMIEGVDLPPDVLFVSLANEDGLVGLDELKRWGELQQMIKEGDLLETELTDLFDSVKKSGMDLNKVEEAGFVDLCKAIDSLFEEDGGVGIANGVRQVSRKEELLDAIADLVGENILPCGLEATEREQREILSIVEMVEGDSTNVIRSNKGTIAPQELDGDWELLYSSSSAMKFNKGLSGLGGSLPNGRFANLKQKLVATKFLTDVEYIERIEMIPSSASFDVKVTGTWDLRTSVSLFTGEPSIVMNVVPDRVTYGPTSTRADHWKSLGPLNMLDITYLDDDLRIMRGNTSVDTVFVFRRYRR